MNNNTKGRIYFCPTPIGNLKDITLRTLQMLEDADIIACEDTRHTLKLLNHYSIKKPLISYHQHNSESAGNKIIEYTNEGKIICLVTDAGMPGISDPGSELVKLAIKHQVAIEVLPGASAFVCALVASGFPTDTFYFMGFLSKIKKQRKVQLAKLQDQNDTIILYESPHNIKNTLSELSTILEPEREICIAKEITKIHENYLHTTISKSVEFFNENPPKGEYVLIIAPKILSLVNEEIHSPKEYLLLLKSEGMDKKDALKKAALDLKIKKSDIYMLANNIYIEND